MAVYPYSFTTAPIAAVSPPPYHSQRIGYDVCDAEWREFHAWLRHKIESLPPFSVARTLFEDDERFYMTFPGSRKAAIEDWKVQRLPSGYSTGPQFLAHSSTTPTTSPLDLHYDYVCPLPIISPTPKRVPSPMLSSYSTLRGFDMSLEPAVEKSPSPEPLPPVTRIVPSHPRPIRRADLVRSFVEQHEQQQQRSSGSSSGAGALLLPPCSRSPSPMAVSERRSHSSPPSRPYTGDWETDALAAERESDRMLTHSPVSAPVNHLSTPSGTNGANIPPLKLSDTPVVVPRTGRRHHLTYRRQRLSRTNSHPYVRTDNIAHNTRSRSSRESSPEVSPVSPVSLKPRKPIGEGKLACLFCRGRKIACQPPPPEESDRTCNQCKRRNQECNYPTENRRGHRKRP